MNMTIIIQHNDNQLKDYDNHYQGGKDDHQYDNEHDDDAGDEGGGPRAGDWALLRHRGQPNGKRDNHHGKQHRIVAMCVIRGKKMVKNNNNS